MDELPSYEHICALVGRLYLNSRVELERVLESSQRAISTLRARLEEAERQLEARAKQEPAP